MQTRLMLSGVYNIIHLPYSVTALYIPKKSIQTYDYKWIIHLHVIITNLYIFEYELVANSDVQFHSTRSYYHATLSNNFAFSWKYVAWKNPRLAYYSRFFYTSTFTVYSYYTPIHNWWCKIYYIVYKLHTI